MRIFGGILMAVFALVLIAFGVMAIGNPDKVKGLATQLMSKTGLFADKGEGIRGQVEYIEGQVEWRLSESDGWREVERDEVVKNGTEIRTLGNSRAVITFEDGSVVRLNTDSLMKFESANELIVIHFSQGEIYNRVTKDDKREFAVEVDSFKVVALGTAFSVEKNEDQNAQVVVVESEVEIKGKKDVVLGTVAEGNKTKLNSDEVNTEQITQEDLKDEFLAWNVKNDEKHFEKKIVLNELEQKAPEEAKEEIQQKTTTQKTVTTKEVTKEVEKKEEKSNDGYATAIGLSGKEDGTKARFNWEISGGKAPEGFKVVKSKQPNPVYPGDDYLYIKDPDDRSCVWKGFYKDKTYHFRICVYKKGKCVTYSNDVEIEFEGKD